jgi:hypothetical protein
MDADRIALLKTLADGAPALPVESVRVLRFIREQLDDIDREATFFRGLGLTAREREWVTTICLIYETRDAARIARAQVTNAVYGQLLIGLN